MKNLPASRLAIAAALCVVLGAAAWESQSSDAEDEPQTVTSTFEVEGMTCGGCELGVKVNVGELDGVVSVEASYEQGEAVVVHDPEKVTPDEIVVAIEELGYSAELQEESEDGAGEEEDREVPS